MTCSRNLSKHFRTCYQWKMFQHDLQKSKDFFLQKRKDQIFPFHIYFSHLCKTSNQKKPHGYDMCIWMFSITLSHFERITWIFLRMMGAITIFRKNSFRFSFVDYGLMTKSFGARCTFEEVAEKTKCQKMNVNFSQPN